MQTIELGRTGVQVSRLVYGCMRLVGDGSDAARERGKLAVRAALDAGYTIFDHADIYADGQCEALFGEVLEETPGLREEIFIVSKCGIRFAGEPAADDPQRYDFSKAHVLESVEGSLGRLGIDSLDLLLLHRPDFLMDANEVKEAFADLEARGLVRHFGVSNFTPSQVDLLRSATDLPLVANQVEINVHRVAAFSDGTLDQCQQLGITPQAWSPLAGSILPAWHDNTFSDDDNERIRVELERQADRYDVDTWLVVLAWLLKHPAGIAPIIGSTTPERIAESARALDIPYTREDWYRLLEARNGHRVA